MRRSKSVVTVCGFQAGFQALPRTRLRHSGMALGWDGEGRNRTGDTTIFSRVLYQLSYLAEHGDGSGASSLIRGSRL
jgi:hypothetical protein